MAEETQTCRDCAHFARFCSWFIGTLTGDETECDWDPSRFRAKDEGRAASAKESSDD